MTKPALVHCLSFDIEEHFQVSAFASPMRQRHWDVIESRVERNTEVILTLLDEKQFKATFFILGWVAERYPHLVRRLVAGGHEIASHGYGHELISAQTPQLFRDDIRRAKEILENITGTPVYGYRAPSFSITEQTKWALPILVEEGYLYDSSIFPILHDRYGMRGTNPYGHCIETSSGKIWELPPSTVKLGGFRFPVAGGGYFRLYPYPLLRWMLQRIEAEGQPLVVYLHPWELDPMQPRMKGSLLSQFRHYLNLTKTRGRLSSLLGDFDFCPLRNIISEFPNGPILNCSREGKVYTA